MNCPCCGQVVDQQLIDYMRREDAELVSFILEGEEE